MKIYNEFSSGGQDLTAIRDFITKLNTPAGTLKYVLILGDTTLIIEILPPIIKIISQVIKVIIVKTTKHHL